MGLIVINDGSFGCTNHSDWYQNGGTQLVFPEVNIAIQSWVWDGNASGMIGNIDTSEPCTYTLLSPTTVQVNFTVLARGLAYTGQWGWGVLFKQTGEPTQVSNVYSLDPAAGNNQWRQIEFELICLVDITTLGVPLGAFAEDTYATIIG